MSSTSRALPAQGWRGRVPALAAGHVGATREAQPEERTAVAATGPDAPILIANHLAAL